MLKAETFIQTLIRKRIVPGISILVARDNTPVYQNQFGCQSLLPCKSPVEPNTLYDLASLTKPLITAFLTLYLVERKMLSLHTEVRTLFPHLERFGAMNLQHLLTHTSGLPGWYPLYLFGEDYLAHYAYMPLVRKPGGWPVYSCPGYILLHYILQKASGSNFRELAREVIFQPLGLTDTHLGLTPDLYQRAAPTELGNRYERKKAESWAKSTQGQFFWPLYLWFPWRESLIQGETHDLYSHYLGGTAGNTGLFSTTTDLFRLSCEFFPASARILKAETLASCWQNLTPLSLSHRTIGFKRNSSLFSSGGRALSRQAIGHNGFTGPSIWMDIHPKTGKSTTLILLCNQIHPEVKNIPFNRLRRKLHGLLLAEL